MNLFISEIFNSMEGEVSGYEQGRLSTFIRFAGCNLNCSYCDTPQSKHLEEGTEMSVGEVMQKVVGIGCRKVTITGGEPLHQRLGFNYLVANLWMEGFDISVETNGSYPIPEGKGIRWIADLKTPDSGMMGQCSIENLQWLRRDDIIKFVVCSHGDYDFAKNRIKMIRQRGIKSKIAFSPCHGKLRAADLLGWMQKDYLYDCLLNLQTHKCAGLK